MLPFAVTKENYEEKVLKSEVPVLVDFWAPWCGYCRRIAPVLGMVSDRLGERLAGAKLNIDELPELGEQYGVDTIPMLTLVRDGKKVGEDLINPPSLDAILDWLRANGVEA